MNNKRKYFIHTLLEYNKNEVNLLLFTTNTCCQQVVAMDAEKIYTSNNNDIVK